VLVSVRGGGHAVAGHAVCDGGLMVDLSLMKAVRVDQQARTARAAGGLLWQELDAATQQFGLATTGGIISHTGIGGLTLGGGLGHLMRKHGLTVDNLLAVDLVTADGERLRVDAASEPELLWGLRGGGGNFGIAAALEYRLHPVGPMVLGGPVFWPLDDAPRVLRFLRDFAPEAPDELGITMAMMLAPPLPFLPPQQVGKPVLGLVLAWAGDPAEGEQATAPLRALGPPLAELVRPVPYLALQSMLDGGAPHGRHYYWKSHRLPGLTDEVVDLLVECLAAITSPFSQIGGWAMGGAVSPHRPRRHRRRRARGRLRPQPRRRVAAHRPRPQAPHRLGPPGLGGAAPAQHRRVGQLPLRRGRRGVQAAYGRRLARLVALNDRMDPTNFFRLNANIPPSQRGDGDRSSGKDQTSGA
jgi:hypothetical protein